MAAGWITDRPPTHADLNEDANACLEVTYKNGLIGWETFGHVSKWKESSPSCIVAWRRIRPAYNPHNKEPNQ